MIDTRCSMVGEKSHPSFRSSNIEYRISSFGFTYIEILITLSLLGILFVPMMQFFSQAVESTRTSRDLITAVSLARWEMERLKNLGTQMESLRVLSGTTYPPAEEPALELNDRSWRIFRSIEGEEMPWIIRVTVKVENDPKTVVELVTLITETSWIQP